MSDEYEYLLREVLISPYDDLPRLVLADWLEENAKDTHCNCRGGWIVTLSICGGEEYNICRLCNGVGSTTDGRLNRANFIREQIANPTDWAHCPYVFCDVIPKGVSVVYTRGFIKYIYLTTDLFYEVCEIIFSVHPVTEVFFTNNLNKTSLDAVHYARKLVGLPAIELKKKISVLERYKTRKVTPSP